MLESLQQIRAAVEQCPLAIVITNTVGQIEYVNPAFTQMTGFSAQDAQGKTPRILKSGKHSDKFYADLWATITEGSMWQGEFFDKRQDGTFYWESARIFPFFDHHGKLTNFIAIKEDITARKETERTLSEMMRALRESLHREELLTREALEASKRKSRLLATASHEIRTPLNGVIGLADLLQDTKLDDEQRELVRTIRDCGKNLLSLVNDLLDFSKIEAGKLELERLAFKPDELLSTVMRLLRSEAIKKHLDLSSTIDVQVPKEIFGDPTRLQQVLVNLGGNAVKFTQTGSVRIKMGCNSHRLLFRVSDTGIGIPEEAKRRLFRPYSQADASIARVNGGTGLGLLISKRLVNLMGGRIGVRSSPGSGSTFWFTIPYSQLDSAAKHTERTSLQSPQGLRVLVAEDDRAGQKVALLMLRRLGCQAEAVSTGEAAVDALAKENFDLVLMDCQMPVLDGFEATSRIRKTSSKVKNRKIPIIAMTGNALAEDRERCLSVGMSDYLTKPVNQSKLAAIIDRWGNTHFHK